MAITARGAQRSFDIWPGFVDALASLLMLIIFVLMIFMVGQFYLTDALTGRDKAMAQLNRRITELSELLSLEQKTSTGLSRSLAEIAAELRASLAARDKARARAKALAGATGSSKKALEAEKKLSAEARSRLDILNQQIAELRRQLASIQEALETSEKKASGQEIKIADLGKRLNLALARKVLELNRYRSEFFGRLREVLGERKDIRIVGDRFVFQSEVLFASGSAEIEVGGQGQLAALATTLLEISKRIPPELNWVLRIDGHTDARPIHSPLFPSNWELSSARAISVVKFLIDQGIPPNRLVAAGFGEFHPLDQRNDEIALRRNRRIELKLTQR